MDNQDKTTFSLDDEEIVEEEVIDRDEEYEDDDYDDYEDDGEYEDEEYDEDDYGDEEYDDGYSDDYYDDRLNKVLDEIAELKRGMVPATVQQQQQQPPSILPPQYIYQPTAPPAGSEVVMYNEISRLRDELARNQSSLEMQKELTRIKEDMARDQRFAEAQYNAEIQRLQSKIDDLLKNGSSPQGDPAESEEPPHVEGSNNPHALNLDKLLSINEAILRTTKDSDARIQNEIAQLKKQFGEMPSLKELNDAVSAVQKALENAEGVKPEALTALSADIAALKTAIEEKGDVAPMPAPAAVAVAHSDGASDGIAAGELLRQLYDIKTVLGNSSDAAVERTRVLSELVNEFKKVSVDVRSQATSFKDKLTVTYAYLQKLAASNEPDAIDLTVACDGIIAALCAQPLTRSVFADVAAFCAENGMMSVTAAMRDSADKFFNICDKLATAKPEAYGEYLADLVAQINVLENNRKQTENGEIVGALVAAVSEETPDEKEIKELLAELIELKVSDVIDLPQADIPEGYTPVAPAEDAVSVFAKLEELKSVVLDAAKQAEERQAAILTAQHEQAERQAAAEQSAHDREQPVVAEQPQQPVRVVETTVSDGAVKELASAIDELKAKLENATETPDFSSALEELRGNYLDITGKLVDISDSLQNAEPQERTVAESVATAEPVLTDDEKERVLDDLAYIRDKADEYAGFINKIDELGAKIAELNNDTVDISAPLAEQLSGLLNDITSQFDKLYEDISNVLIESEANILNHIAELGDGKGVADAVEAAKADILADTQNIKDTLLTVTDSIYALPLNENLEATKADILADTQSIKDSLLVLSDQLGEMQNGGITDDAVEQLRADVAALLELTSADHELATTERQKILDDIAYLREQAEFAIADEEEEAISETATDVQDGDKLTAYLDEISARVAQLATIADDTSFTKDNVVALTDSVAAANDGMSALTDGLTAVTDAIAAVNDGVTSVSETLHPLADDVTAARDAATAALDALTPISDQLNAILDRLETGVEDSTEYVSEAEPAHDYVDSAIMSDEELVELKDSLNTILDTLPLFPQADDVVAARDNTYSILDALTAMPQADDVIVTRDNVAAILDAVNALSDSLTNTVAAQSNDDITALRETVESASEDIRFIRQKLENGEPIEEQGEDIANIMQDIGLVLDKIEEYEALSGNNKQEIIDAVNGIREEIHINTLDENMSAAGMDDGTRDALVGEIAEIRERLGNIEDVTKSLGDVNGSMLDGITAQLDELRRSLEERIVAGGGAEQGDVSQTSENMQAIFDELTSLKEKLDMRSEYDTVEEILSLREDIKAARIVDQDEVTSELEAIKNELASISSGNILDEIRALREDVINLPNAESGLAPTDGEVNLVLNEIVSLRDEMFAFKDEVLNATAAMVGTPEVGDEIESVDGGEDITTILDELTALRADQSALNGNIDELKDIVSRRTSLGVAESDGEESVAPNAGELDVVLDEIINLKNDVDRIVESMGDDKLTVMSEQIDEIRAVIDELRNGMPVAEHTEGDTDPASVDLTPVMEQLENVNAALDDLRLNREAGAVTDDGAVGSTFAERFDELRDDIDDIKAAVNDMAVPVDYSAELAELRAEIDALRAENEALRQENNDAVSARLVELKDLIRESLTLSASPATTPDGDTSYAALIEEIRDLKDQVAVSQYPAPIDEELLQAIRDAVGGGVQQQGATDYGNELAEIRDEIAQLRSLTAISAESGGAAELDGMRAELAELKSLISSQDNLFGVAEDVTAIRADVQTLRDEPDLGVMNEILALRDEFQALREQIEDVKRIAGETDKQSDESIMSEVQSLRDQLFAISMANVNDPSSGESNYESYNNIILDELAAIRDQISVTDTANDIAAVMDEIDRLKAAIDKRDETVEAVVERVAKLNNNVANDRIMAELESLRTDLSNQRDADMTTLNFMSELAHLVERQNQYLTQNQDSGVRISDEIESLKAEIASSDAVAEEVAKLREVMTQSGNASDNETILSELAKLREELSQEKPSRENDIILDAIARLGDEITVLAEREKARDIESDAGLSDSLSALKDQLSQIADIVEPEDKPSAPKPASGAKRGKKSGQTSKSSSKSTASASKKKSSTSSGGAKRGRKPAQKPSVTQPSSIEPVTTVIDIDSRINEQVESLNGAGDMALNINDLVTGDAMDLADKLAKQVANKLIMEQLVEQLGDGGVSEERVDEILRDILPQEFTTIAETEASDKVRRLANRLVLDKLRARLNGRSDD